MTFAARLTHLLTEHNLSLWQLAARASLVYATVTALQRGDVFPRSTTQDALAAAFGLTREELMADVERHTRRDGRAKVVTL